MRFFTGWILFAMNGFWIVPVIPCPTECVCNSDIVRCESTDGDKLQHIPAPPAIPDNTRILYLEYQNISTIRGNDFEQLTSLESLTVRSSNVQIIEDKAFQHLSELNSLTLSNNSIAKINELTFIGLDKLSQLNLYNNPDLVMNACSTSWLANLKRLFLLQTSATLDYRLWLNCQNQSLSHAVYDIETLSIGGSGSQVDNDFLLSLRRLSTFAILYPPVSLLRGYNISSLGSLNDLTLKGLSFFPREFLIHGSLSSIEISASSVTHLPANGFSNLPGITSCYVTSSGLVYIHRDAFRGLSQLTTLRLYNNKLQTLPAGLFADIQLPLQTLSLYDNPWNCNRTLHWLLDVVREEVSMYSPLSDGRCNSPVALTGVPLGEVDIRSSTPRDPPLNPTGSTPPLVPSPTGPPGTRPPFYWSSIAMTMAAVLIILLAIVSAVCWFRASRRSRMEARNPPPSTGRDGIGGVNGANPNDADPRGSGNAYYYPDDVDNVPDRRGDTRTTQETLGGVGTAVPVTITHQYWNDPADDVAEGVRRGRNEYSSHIYAMTIEPDIV